MSLRVMRTCFSILLFFGSAFLCTIRAERVSEKQKVLILIARIEELRDAVLILGGVKMSPAEAASWMRKDKALSQPEDDVVASLFIYRVSESAENVPNWIIFKDGRRVKVQFFLEDALKRAEHIPKGAE